MTSHDSSVSTASDPIAVIASPSGTFITTAFGAVALVTGNRVNIPADRVEAFKAVHAQLTAIQPSTGKALPNTTVFGPIPVDDAKAADLLRKQVRQWADDNDASVSFRGLVKLPADATPEEIKAAAEDTKVNEHGVPWNDDNHVTFRLASKKDKAEVPAQRAE